MQAILSSIIYSENYSSLIEWFEENREDPASWFRNYYSVSLWMLPVALVHVGAPWHDLSKSPMRSAPASKSCCLWDYLVMQWRDWSYGDVSWSAAVLQLPNSSSGAGTTRTSSPGNLLRHSSDVAVWFADEGDCGRASSSRAPLAPLYTPPPPPPLRTATWRLRTVYSR